MPHPHPVISYALALACLSTSCSRQPQAETPIGNDLNSVLWVQTAAEYRALCEQTFAAATAALKLALADRSWSAALEQTGASAEARPPAVICDVDETLLDNSAYNARLLAHGKGEGFSLDTWNAWVEERRALPVPGAKAFLKACRELGVTVFYVTNRGSEVEAATRDNLRSVGFPLEEFDTLLTRNDIDEAGSEKSPRRTHVANTHRILLLLGDDLGDFVPNSRKASRKERAELTEQHRDQFGTRWFMLPNPIYGSWLSALGDGLRGTLRR